MLVVEKPISLSNGRIEKMLEKCQRKICFYKNYRCIVYMERCLKRGAQMGWYTSEVFVICSVIQIFSREFIVLSFLHTTRKNAAYAFRYERKFCQENKIKLRRYGRSFAFVIFLYHKCQHERFSLWDKTYPPKWAFYLLLKLTLCNWCFTMTTKQIVRFR